MPAESKFSTANATKTLEDAGYKKNSDGYYEKGGKVAAITYTTFSDSASTKAKQPPSRRWPRPSASR